MNNEFINSFSLIGRICSINEIKEQSNGNKFRYFSIVQNNNYVDKDGNSINEPSFICIKVFEKNFEEFEDKLKVGNLINVFGKIKVYKNADGKDTVVLIGLLCREILKTKEVEEVFDYDWLNDNQEIDKSDLEKGGDLYAGI